MEPHQLPQVSIAYLFEVSNLELLPDRFEEKPRLIPIKGRVTVAKLSEEAISFIPTFCIKEEKGAAENISYPDLRRRRVATIFLSVSFFGFNMLIVDIIRE